VVISHLLRKPIHADGFVLGLAMTIAGLTLCAPRSASAQSPPAAAPAPPAADAPATDDPAERARELFREGVALMAADDHAGALAKFKAVARFKMSAQVAFNIAECEENLGKLVSALGNYRLALAKAEGGVAEKVAEAAPQRIAALEPRIAKLTVLRKDEKPNPAATIDLDGIELGAEQIGKPIPADPGERTLRVLVRGRAVASERVRLGAGEAKTITLLVPAPVEGDADTPSAGSAGISIPGIVLTAFGGASLIAGGVFIGVRQAAISDLDEQCGGDETCPPSAESDYDRGRLFTGLAQVAIPVGVASTTVGIIFLAMGIGASGDEPASDDVATFVGSAPGADAGASLMLRF
jgi:hypothetical protein